MARLLTKKQVLDSGDVNPNELGEGVLYLELRHTPSTNIPKPLLLRDAYSKTAMLTPFRTYIPLQQEHLNAIMDNMYTARLVFKNGYAQRYSVQMKPCGAHCPRFPDVPDGTYELYFGKLYHVGFGAKTSEAEANHPLLSKTPENVQRLFNLGIEMNTAFEPKGKQQIYYPNRYAYLRDGDLYVMGIPLLKKENPLLKDFLEKELLKEKSSTSTNPYVAFRDYGPPPNTEFIKTFGLTIPPNHYYVLGDNHAMSGDSRAFGFVPEDNLQGVPSLIVWPPGERWGVPANQDYDTFVKPRIFVWGLALLALLAWGAIHYYRIRQPIFKKINK